MLLALAVSACCEILTENVGDLLLHFIQSLGCTAGTHGSAHLQWSRRRVGVGAKPLLLEAVDDRDGILARFVHIFGHVFHQPHEGHVRIGRVVEVNELDRG